MRGCRFGLFQDGQHVLVQDLGLGGLHAVAEVPDDGIEAVVVGDLLESERLHLLQVELDTSDPGVDMLSVDEVLLAFDKVLVVQLLIFKPIAFLLTQKTEEAVAQAL